MGGLLDRLPILLEESKEDIPYLKENSANKEKDANGSSSNALANALWFSGVGEYLVNSNVAAYKSCLRDAANLRLSLIRRFDNGEPISKSYISMLSYRFLFAALASGDLALSRELALAIGERRRLEAKSDHPFDKALGYALRAVVLETSDMKDMVAQFKLIARKPNNKDFTGYADAFDAIQRCDVSYLTSALNKIQLGHIQQSLRGGVFKDSADEVLCVWGLGLINLARSKGIDFKFDSPLMPAILTS